MSARLSVVIPTRGRPQQVLALVERLCADPDLHEVVVVADGDDEAFALLEQRTGDLPRLRARWQPHAGEGAARQHGVREATGDVVLLVDDDVLPEPGLVRGHLAEHARHDGPVLVVGALHTARPARRTPDSITTELYVEDYEGCTRSWGSDPDAVLTDLWAGNLSLPRATALAVGLGDPAMAGLYFEDRDLGLRLRRAGVRAVHRPDLVVRHVHQRSLAAFLADGVRQGRAMVVLHERHPDVVVAPDRWTAQVHRLARLPGRLVLRGGVASRVLPELVLLAARLTGRLRAWRAQRALVLLLRRLGQARGISLQSERRAA